MKTWKRVVPALWLMLAVSGLVKVYGLEQQVFFNKGIISAGVFLLGWQVSGIVWKHWQENRRNCLWGYGMALALVFTEVLGIAMRLAVDNPAVALHPAGICQMLFAAIGLAILAEPVFYRMIPVVLAPAPQRYEGVSLRNVFWGSWGCLLLGYLPCLLAFYPGLFCYDISWQWDMAVNHNYSTHHPLIHTLFSGRLLELGGQWFGSYNGGLLLHSIVQLVIFTGCLAFALRFLVKRKVHPAVVLGIGAYYLLFPFFPVLGISTTKDTIFGGLFLVSFACVCEMVEEKRFYRGWRLGAFVAVTVLMCLLRNNSIHTLCLMLGVLGLAFLVQWMRKKPVAVLGKMMGLILVCLVVSQGAYGLMERGLHATKGSEAEMLSLPMQQMARTYVRHKEEIPEEQKAALRTYFDESALDSYKYYVSDPVKAGFYVTEFRENPRAFFDLWLDLGRQFPGEYLASPLYNVMGLWYMGGDSSCYLAYEYRGSFDSTVHVVEMQSKLPWLKNIYSWFTDEHIQQYLPGISLFFYTAFYSWCVALAAGIMAAKRKYRYLVLPLILACYGFTLIFGPCILLRYFLCVILCVPILCVMTFQSR